MVESGSDQNDSDPKQSSVVDPELEFRIRIQQKVKEHVN